VAELGYLTVIGHEDIRLRLSRAAELSRLPQSLLLYGPRGVGKQRLALWTAAMLNCTGGSPRPCGACRACRLAARLEHPDIHWFFPLPRPKRVSSADQLEQKLEDYRAELLEERRTNRLYHEEEEGATGIYVAAVRTMRRLAYKAPAMGPVKVLLIGQAEALVPQLGNPEAANALLKLLEEPPADTTLILTSDVPGALLPTIRSRVQAVRVHPLPMRQVAEFLTSELDATAAEARRLASLSSGSIGRALQLLDEARENLQEGGVTLVRALLDGSPAARLAAAHAYRSFGARGAFGRALSETRSLLRDLLAVAAGADSAAADPELVASLAGGTASSPEQIISALAAVDEARELADRNVNPQLIVVNLLCRASLTPGTAPIGSSALEGRR
jgi:DNA polymerase-3 subunit delta'